MHRINFIIILGLAMILMSQGCVFKYDASYSKSDYLRGAKQYGVGEKFKTRMKEGKRYGIPTDN